MIPTLARGLHCFPPVGEAAIGGHRRLVQPGLEGIGVHDGCLRRWHHVRGSPAPSALIPPGRSRSPALAAETGLVGTVSAPAACRHPASVSPSHSPIQFKARVRPTGPPHTTRPIRVFAVFFVASHHRRRQEGRSDGPPRPVRTASNRPGPHHFGEPLTNVVSRLVAAAFSAFFPGKAGHGPLVRCARGPAVPAGWHPPFSGALAPAHSFVVRSSSPAPSAFGRAAIA